MGRAAGHGLGWLRFFEEVPEPRQKAKVLYPLPELLLCCLVGVLCGAEGWVEVEEYGEAKLDFLRRFLPFDHGIPSHDTFSDVFNALDPEGFKAAFIAWTATLQENVREIVAIDGKTLRRSFDRGQGQGPIHMISAWAAGQRLVLG
jgi:DDE_Tnp_1-associated